MFNQWHYYMEYIIILQCCYHCATVNASIRDTRDNNNVKYVQHCSDTLRHWAMVKRRTEKQPQYLKLENLSSSNLYTYSSRYNIIVHAYNNDNSNNILQVNNGIGNNIIITTAKVTTDWAWWLHVRYAYVMVLDAYTRVPT